MTIRELAELAGRQPLPLIAAFVATPVVAWVLGRLHGRVHGGQAPWKYLYWALVYMACVPGIFAAVLTGYALCFTRENLLDVNLLVYIFPLLSMVVTLALIRKNVAFELVPGFDRLSGLMVMIGCSFAITLAIEKTRIW